VQDHYKTLGVDKTASASDIKLAYRRLASQHHPDKGGDKTRFQAIQEAYSVLGDAARRAEYDNPRGPGPGFAGGAHFNFDDIFSMFGTRFNTADINEVLRLQLWITLEDVNQGGPRTISLAGSRGQTTAEIVVPPGIVDGEAVRYPKIGPGGADLVVQFRVRPHNFFERRGQDLHCSMPVLIWDLILGCDLEVMTLAGNKISIKVDAGTQPNRTLRVRGHGLPSQRRNSIGDMLITLQPRIPENISQSLMDHIAQERNNK